MDRGSGIGVGHEQPGGQSEKCAAADCGHCGLTADPQRRLATTAPDGALCARGRAAMLAAAAERETTYLQRVALRSYVFVGTESWSVLLSSLIGRAVIRGSRPTNGSRDGFAGPADPDWGCPRRPPGSQQPAATLLSERRYRDSDPPVLQPAISYAVVQQLAVRVDSSLCTGVATLARPTVG